MIYGFIAPQSYKLIKARMYGIAFSFTNNQSKSKHSNTLY